MMEIHSVGAPLIHTDRSTDLLADMTKMIIGVLHDCVETPNDLAKGKQKYEGTGLQGCNAVYFDAV